MDPLIIFKEKNLQSTWLEKESLKDTHCGQGIIQKKSASGSRTLPFVSFDKKCPFCQK